MASATTRTALARRLGRKPVRHVKAMCIHNARTQSMTKILIAGMGNILRRDDGFCVEDAKRLATNTVLPAGATVVEVGIGGIHLVQGLMAGFTGLFVIDALERGSEPGTVPGLEANA